LLAHEIDRFYSPLMIKQIGKYSDLVMNRESPHGVYLQFDDIEVLLPNKYVPEGLSAGDTINVFVYKDSEDRLVATDLRAAGEVGDYVALKVVEIASFGAFMDWGLEKHLLVPNAEMSQKMEVGTVHVVKIVLDYQTERLIGIGKIEDFLQVPEEFTEGEMLPGLVYKRTDLGYKVVVDHQYLGLVYHNTIFKPIAVGQQIECYIDKLRHDGKMDIRLTSVGKESIDADAALLLKLLEEHGGAISLTDKSSPEEIKKQLGLSKKAFKRAVGSLYKLRKIELLNQEIKLNN